MKVFHFCSNSSLLLFPCQSECKARSRPTKRRARSEPPFHVKIFVPRFWNHTTPPPRARTLDPPGSRTAQCEGIRRTYAGKDLAFSSLPLTGRGVWLLIRRAFIRLINWRGCKGHESVNSPVSDRSSLVGGRIRDHHCSTLKSEAAAQLVHTMSSKPDYQGMDCKVCCAIAWSVKWTRKRVVHV